MQNKKPSGARQGTPVPRIIKKYPNRRLYDTDTSTYITLAEVRHLVMDSEPFVVRDAKTNEDLTRSILLQIILEAEAGGAPMFTEAVLANIIRFYGNAMQGFMDRPRTDAPPIRAYKIILVGDSTMAPGSGWASMFCAEHVKSSVACLNLGRGGRSTRSYRQEGSWAIALTEARVPGYAKTYVLIQFGHNDQSSKPER